MLSRLRLILLALAILSVKSDFGLEAADPAVWSRLAPLPDQKGLGGPFSGVHRGVLLVGGGTNFPGKMPWEGGTKVWHDTIYALDRPDGKWSVAGKLPRPLGYCVALSTPEGIACLGGGDLKHHYADCFLLRWDDGAVAVEPLPSLPQPCAYSCGALLGSTIYVAGGHSSPAETTTMATFWSLDLNDREDGWQSQPSWPGPGRMLAVAAVTDHSFFLAGGTALTAGSDGKPVRTYLTDAYRFQPATGWTQIADLPRPAVAAPTPAPVMPDQSFLVLSGDDGSLVDFKPPEKHPGFPRSILAYDPSSNLWSSKGEVPSAQVTTTIAHWNDSYIMPSGEIRPGIRSSDVWSLKVR